MIRVLGLASSVMLLAWLVGGCGDDESTATGVAGGTGSGGGAGTGGVSGSGGTGGVATGGGGTGGAGGTGPEPDCAAENGASCYYVASDGDDANPGTLESPFKTFGAAMVLAQPGDFIYARGGTYTQDNAMVSGVNRDYDSHPATSCPPGQVLADQYCFSDAYSMISINDFSGWASNTPARTLQRGEEQRPITIRNFPTETPVLQVADFTTRAVTVSLKSHWIIQGFEIVGGMVNIGGGTDSEQTHDITIRGCNVHDVTVDGGDNPGLIRINRGDTGGPYNIFIHDNEIHGIYDWEQPGQWDGVPDSQHFGAVTTLSRENYFGFDGGGTGYIQVRGNHIYHCPQAFFFKNPMAGPIEIFDNVIHEVGRIGNMGSANVHMIGNMVYDVHTGWWAVGNEGYPDPRLHAIAGQDAIIQYNTFVGLDSLLGMRCGTGHTVTNNIFFGMSGRMQGVNWDTSSYISKAGSYPDPVDPAASILHEVTSDQNCFITPTSDFQFVVRYLPPEVTGADWVLDHWDYTQANSIFGFDGASVFHIESDPAAVFTSPSGGDYHLQNPDLCPDMGVYAPSRP